MVETRGGAGTKNTKKKRNMKKIYSRNIKLLFCIAILKRLMHVKQLIKAYPVKVGLLNGVCSTMTAEL